MTITWLHVSDFHIRGGDSYDRETVLEELVKSTKWFRENGRIADLIFASGDIAHSGKPDQYALASTFFDELLEAAGLDRRRLFVVPGNHDVDRDLSTDLSRTLSSQEESDNYFRPGRQKLHLKVKLQAFQRWFDGYFEGIRQFADDSSYGPVEAVEIRGFTLGILPINSCIFALDGFDREKLWIGRRSVRDAVKSLNQTNARLKLALLHHPFDWLHPEDRTPVKSELQEGVDVILRGHLHEPDAEFIQSPSGKALHIAAGATYQSSHPKRAWYCTVSGAKIKCFPIRFEDTPKPVWVVDPSQFPREPDHEGCLPLPRPVESPLPVPNEGSPAELLEAARKTVLSSAPFYDVGSVTESTTEQVRPRASNSIPMEDEIAHAIKSLLSSLVASPRNVGSLGLGNIEVPPDSPPETPQFFIRRSSLERALEEAAKQQEWIWVHGAMGYGKTSLVGGFLGDRRYTWISFPNGDSPELLLARLRSHLLRLARNTDHLGEDQRTLPFRELAGSAALALGSGELLVVDNVPRLQRKTLLSDALISLSTACRLSHTPFISISQFASPAVGTVPGSVTEIEVVPLRKEEILQLLQIAGVPGNVDSDRLAQFILGLSRGHPLLCQARIQLLRRKGWVLDDPVAEEFLTGPEALHADMIRELIATTGEAERQLLYRLSLAEQPFNVHLADRLARVEPRVPGGREHLFHLLGPWLRRRSAEEYEVSPLLSTAGKGGLDDRTQQAVHLEIAHEYLSRKQLDQFTALSTSIHLLQAKAWDELAVFMLNLSGYLDHVRLASTFEPISSLLPGKNWPSDLPARTQGCYFAVQAQILATLGKDPAPVLARLDAIAEGSTAIEIFVPLVIAGPLNRHLRAGLQAERTIRVIRLCPALPEDISVPASQLLSENLIWLTSNRIESHEDVQRVLRVLRNMNSSERLRSFSDATLFDIRSSFFESLVQTENKKGEPDRNWGAVLAILDEADKVADLEGAGGLKPFVARTRAIVLAEHLGRSEDAISSIKAVLPRVDATGGFLLRYTAAAIHFDQRNYEEALSYLETALANTSQGAGLYLALARDLAIDASLRAGRLARAKELILRRLQHDREFLMASRRLELLGELAWLHWSFDDHKRAAGTLVALIRALIVFPEGPSAVELSRKSGHFAGQLFLMLGENKATSGLKVPDMFPGLFVTPRSVTGTPPASQNLTLLSCIVGSIASKTGMPRLASRLLGDALADDDGRIERTQVAVFRLEQALAISDARDHKRAFEVFLLSGGDAEQASGKISCEDPPPARGAWERCALFFIVAPGLLDALAGAGSQEAVREEIDLFGQVLHDRPGLSGISEFWVKVFSELRMAYSRFATKVSLEGQLKYVNEIDSILRALVALAFGFCPEVQASLVAGYQAAAFSSFLAGGKASLRLLDPAARFISKFWNARRKMISEITGASEASLDQALSDSSPATVARLLVLSTKGIQLPGDVRVRLDTIGMGAEVRGISR